MPLPAQKQVKRENVSTKTHSTASQPEYEADGLLSTYFSCQPWCKGRGGRKMCCESMRYSAEVDEGNICHKALSMYFLVRNEIGRCTKTAGKEGVHSRERINFLVQSPCYCLVGECQSQNLRKALTFSDPQFFNGTLYKHRSFLVRSFLVRSNLG